MPALALQHRPDFENIFPADHPLAKRDKGESISLSPESPRLQSEALRRIVFFHSLFRRRMNMITHHTPDGGTIIHLDTQAQLNTHQTIVIPPAIQDRTRDLGMLYRTRMMRTLYTRSQGGNWEVSPALHTSHTDHNHQPITQKKPDDHLPELEQKKPEVKVLYVRPNTKEVPAMLQLPAHNPSETPTALKA
jgi:hypothetical protein